jgi:hypothetical protein
MVLDKNVLVVPDRDIHSGCAFRVQYVACQVTGEVIRRTTEIVDPVPDLAQR